LATRSDRPEEMRRGYSLQGADYRRPFQRSDYTSRGARATIEAMMLLWAARSVEAGPVADTQAVENPLFRPQGAAALEGAGEGAMSRMARNPNRVTREWANRRWLLDQERIFRISHRMRVLGFTEEDIARWIREASGNALGPLTGARPSRELPPWPEPWSLDYPQ
jgi:hypothetical protein